MMEIINKLSANKYCKTPTEIALEEISSTRPPLKISTLEYSKTKRMIRQSNGTKIHWNEDITPYLPPVMEALDSPLVREVVVAKPSRTGGTVVAENYALKMMEYGPAGDIMWYLAGPKEVSSYADRVFKELFEDHDGVSRKIGSGVGDNKLTMKKIGGYKIELLAMSAQTTTNRQAVFIVLDEPDSYNKKFNSNFLDQARQRGSMLGNQRKVYACAHPDVGWSGGISQAWLQSSMGIFVMPCADCGDYASPYPTKHWDNVPRYRLHYKKLDPQSPIGERLKVAGETASMQCPSCGSCLNDEQRASMVKLGEFMHYGQKLDVRAGIIGDADHNETMGFWIHILMAPKKSLSSLARDMEGAVEHYERTGKTQKIKQVMVRTFGEVFESASDLVGLDARSLKKRTEDNAVVSVDEGKYKEYKMGVAPDWVKFITAAVDVGGDKFDVLIRGWDLERRSCLIDRFTIRQREHSDGVFRDIKPSKVQDDSNVLESQVIDRLIPMQSDPSKALPIAVTFIDCSDGNYTWNGYEFVRRMDHKRWGTWRKVRAIKGATTPTAPHLSPVPRKINKDNEGNEVEPVVTLHMIGVYGIKEDLLDTLAIEDGSPGQCYFAKDTPDHAFNEFFNETLIEGKWVRNGANETFDLYVYTEAARTMLEPDREDRDWEEGYEPIWAYKIDLTEKDEEPEEDAPSSESKKTSIFDDFSSLNNG